MKKQTVFILFIVVIALAVGLWREYQDAPNEPSASQLNSHLSAGTLLGQPKKLAAFDLIDMESKPFTNQSLKGQWSFLFFGYTSCPDICPTTLGAIQQIASRLQGTANLQFVFVSINPEKDSPLQLKDYLSQEKFNIVNFVGVTGEKEKIQTLAESVGIHTVQSEHSSTLLLINPEGKLAAIFTSSEKPQAIARDFKEVVHRYITQI